MTDDEIKKVAKATADEVFRQAWKASVLIAVIWIMAELGKVWLTH